MGSDRKETRSEVVFMCPYGGAKSVVAASYFNRMAERDNLPFKAIAVAAEEPYQSVPPKVAEHLERDGFKVSDFKPRRVTPADLEAASTIVSIDCDLDKVDTRGRRIERWDDVPKISADLEGSIAAIQKHVEALVSRLKSRR